MMPLLTSAVKATPLIDMPGLVWRHCRFQVCDVTCTHDGPSGPIELSPDLIGAVPKRRSEFLAGRTCAAFALAELGAPTYVGRNGRAPVWPAGFCGSISHSNDWAISVALRGKDGVGVDCEQLIRPELARDIAPTVLAPGDDTHFISDLDFAENLTLAFAAKEAAYKALAPHLNDIPDFTEARIRALKHDLLGIEFRGRHLPVHIRLDGDWAVALCLPNGSKKGDAS